VSYWLLCAQHTPGYPYAYTIASEAGVYVLEYHELDNASGEYTVTEEGRFPAPVDAMSHARETSGDDGWDIFTSP
jgi:hypothetical protein